MQSKSNLIIFICTIGILLLLNILSTKFHKRLDLTDDHRFTLSKPTKKYLRALKDPVTIKVLLDGKMPSNYQKLRSAAIDVLSAFREESNGKVQFSFENPIAGKSIEEKIKLNEEFKKKGIFGVITNPQIDEDGGGIEQRIVYPYARIAAAGKEESFCLQQQKTIANNESAVDDLLNYSESMMEYNIINAIRTIQQPSKKSIAYVVGHGEPTDYRIMHMLFTMTQFYKVDTIKLSEQIQIPNNYVVTVINNPRSAFSDKEKLIIDQYIMNGGHTLWLLDGVQVSNDSLIKYPNYTALPLEHNLSDILYKYGVRLNSNLVQDRQCGSLVVQVGIIDGKADYRPLDWDFYPVVTPIAKHPIVHNMDPVWMRYASSLDTINNNLSKKTILLESSNLSKSIAAPALISLNSLKLKPKMSSYTKKYIPMAVAIEGGFKSAFSNRLSPEQLALYEGDLKLKFKDEVSDSKMIVIADGDFFLNDKLRGDVPSEMAFDKFTDRSYANSTFMLNALEWLSDETGLLEARNKDVQLRRMDPKKIKAYRTQYQLLNILLPIGLTIFLGSLWHFLRKKKYTASLKK